MIDKVYVPPVKIQGIKTKLVKTIADNIYLEKILYGMSRLWGPVSLE